jgi:hypothetical protein
LAIPPNLDAAAEADVDSALRAFRGLVCRLPAAAKTTTTTGAGTKDMALLDSAFGVRRTSPTNGDVDGRSVPTSS